MRRVPLLTVISLFAIAATAKGALPASATATPHRAGKASTVHFVIDGAQAPISARIPSSLVMSLPQGFVLDPRAAPKRCGKTSASLNECPSASKIGTASLTITVLYAGHPPRDVTFNLTVYRHSTTSVYGVTFLAGVRVVPGTLSTTHGITIKFDPLPKPPVFQQVSYELKRITFNLGVTRKVTVKRRVRVHGHFVTRHRTVMHSLIHNPTKCSSGTWPGSASLGFPDGTSAQFATPITCSA